MAEVLAENRHRSGWGAWTLVRGRPAPALRAVAVSYEGYLEAGAAPVLRRERPIPRYPIIFNFGGGWRLRADRPGAEWQERRASFVAGLSDHAFFVRAAGGAHCLQVDLTPLGARRVLGIDLAEIANAVVPLDALLGPAVGRLEDALAAARGWPGRFELVDAFLAARLAAGRGVSPAVAAAWAVLARTGGRARVGRLAARAGLTREGLAAGFRREIGLAPKTAGRVLRLERAVGLIGAGLGLAEVAVAAGYADQAHLGREMRALAGESPAGLRARLLADGGGLMA